MGSSSTIPVVVAVDKEAVIAVTIRSRSIGERHSLVAVVHRPHPELHRHLTRGEVLKVCRQQHLQDGAGFAVCRQQQL